MLRNTQLPVSRMEKHLRHTDRQAQARPQQRIPRARPSPLDVEFQRGALALPSAAEVDLLLTAFASLLGELVEALDHPEKD